jgi:Cof subfamily protein (haloacid dehalogenase superfamily)
MEKYTKALGLNKRRGYLICGNGSFITRSDTGEVVFERFVPSKVALTCYDLADAEGFCMQTYGDHEIIISRVNEYSNTDEKLTGMKQTLAPDFRSLVEKGVHKLVIPGDPMILVPFLELLRAYVGDEATLFTSKPYFVEVLPPGANKGSSLAWVAGKLGIKQEETLAFGDSMNDEAMIRWAGTGVCMRNGDERVKAIADAITDRSNDNDGVADYVEKHVLRGKGSQKEILWT